MKQRKVKKQYHYFYKIENIINGFYYYGIHSTNNLNDGYMGSGRKLKRAQQIYGIENFVKTILKYFDTREECANYEALIVNEQCINDPECYNVVLGGDTGLTYNTLLTIDSNGNYHRVTYTDERYLNGELKPFSIGKTAAYDKIDKKYVWITQEEFNNSDSRYVGCTKNKIVVKDKNGNYYSIDINDERYLNGELVPTFTGLKHSEETKQKMKDIFKKNKHQQGEKNSQYGTMWIYNNETHENKKINKNSLSEYSSELWTIGRYVDNKKLYKLKLEGIITITELQNMRSQGKSWSDIAKTFGVSRDALLRYRQKYNL